MPSRLIQALHELTAGCSGAQVGEIIGVPKRTAERWLAELREGILDNWHGHALEKLADHEWKNWGTTRIVEALKPEVQIEDLHDCADASRVARAMRTLITSHQANSALIGEMASALADSVIEDHEARSLLPLVQQALAASASKHKDLTKLERMLRNRLKLRAGAT